MAIHYSQFRGLTRLGKSLRTQQRERREMIQARLHFALSTASATNERPGFDAICPMRMPLYQNFHYSFKVTYASTMQDVLLGLFVNVPFRELPVASILPK